MQGVDSNSDEQMFRAIDAELRGLTTATAEGEPEMFEQGCRRIFTAYEMSSSVVQYKILTDFIQLGYRDVLPLLRSELRSNTSALVRHEAAFGLGVFRATEDAGILIDAMLNDADVMVRHEAAIALAATGGLSALAALEHAARDPDRSVAESAKFAIHQIKIELQRAHSM